MSEKKSNKPGKMAGLFVQLKNIFGLNIATVAFGVLLLYMIFTAFLLVTSTHIESYQVTTGPLSRTRPTLVFLFGKRVFLRQNPPVM